MRRLFLGPFKRVAKEGGTWFRECLLVGNFLSRSCYEKSPKDYGETFPEPLLLKFYDRYDLLREPISKSDALLTAKLTAAGQRGVGISETVTTVPGSGYQVVVEPVRSCSSPLDTPQRSQLQPALVHCTRSRSSPSPPSFPASLSPSHSTTTPLHHAAPHHPLSSPPLPPMLVTHPL